VPALLLFFARLGVFSLLLVMTTVRTACALEIQDLYGKLAGGCWACDMLGQAGGIGLDMAQQLFDTIAQQLVALLGMLMAINLLVQAGRIFLPFGMDGPPSRQWNHAVRQLVAFAVVLAFLQSAELFWNYLFMPIFSLGTSLSARLLSQSSLQSCSVNGIGSGISGAKAALDGMNCPLSLIQDVFTRGMLTGVAMTLGASWHSWMDVIKVWSWPGQLLQMLSGVVLALVYAFGFIMFPLFFLDTVLRAAIVAVFAPLAAAMALFSPTRRVTVRALWDLARSALTLVFASVAAGLTTRTIVTVYASLKGGDDGRFSDWPSLIGALESGTLQLSMVDQSYWIILAVGFIAIFLVRGAARMAAVLTEGAGSGPGGAAFAAAAMVALGTRLTAAATRRSVSGRQGVGVSNHAKHRSRVSGKIGRLGR
jgi:hypothetical protein